MKKILFLIVPLFLFLQGYNQSKDSLRNVYNNQTIYRLGDYYIKGNERLTFINLQSEFQSDITKELYRRSKNSLLTSKIFHGASLALILASAFIFSHDQKGVTTFFAATIILGLGGQHFRKQSTQFLDRAMWQRNKEVLFGER